LVFSGKSGFKAIKKWHTKELLSLLWKSDLKKEFSSPVLIGTILYDRLSEKSTKKDETINWLYDVGITREQKEIIIHMEQAVRNDPISLANAA
jgi:hypothetical protein